MEKFCKKVEDLKVLEVMTLEVVPNKIGVSELQHKNRRATVGNNLVQV